MQACKVHELCPHPRDCKELPGMALGWWWCCIDLEGGLSITSLYYLHQVLQKNTSEAAWPRRPSGPSSFTANTATSSDALTTA